MVKISTLFHRVDGFSEPDFESLLPELLDLHTEACYLHDLLEPLIYDPGEQIVQAILQKV